MFLILLQNLGIFHNLEALIVYSLEFLLIITQYLIIVLRESYFTMEQVFIHKGKYSNSIILYDITCSLLNLNSMIQRHLSSLPPDSYHLPKQKNARCVHYDSQHLESCFMELEFVLNMSVDLFMLLILLYARWVGLIDCGCNYISWLLLEGVQRSTFYCWSTLTFGVWCGASGKTL